MMPIARRAELLLRDPPPQYGWQNAEQPPRTKCATPECKTFLSRANIMRERDKATGKYRWVAGHCFPCRDAGIDTKDYSAFGNSALGPRLTLDEYPVTLVAEDALDVLLAAAEPMSARDIARVIGRSPQKTGRALRILYADGKATHVSMDFGDKRVVYWVAVRDV